MMDEGVVEIILRYNGYWRSIPRTGRKKYECGNQKSLRVDVRDSSLKKLGELIYEFLPTVKGSIMKLSYTIPETNPRRFARIKTNGVYLGVLKNHLNKRRLQMFLTLASVSEISWRAPVSNRRKNPPRENTYKSSQTIHIDMDELSSEEDEDLGVSDDRFVNMGIIQDEFDGGVAENDGGLAENDFDWGLNDNEVDGDNFNTVVDEENFETETTGAQNIEMEGYKIEVNNVEDCEDDADDCVPDDDYHSLRSSEGEEEIEDEADNVGLNGEAVYDLELEDPQFYVGKKFNDLTHLRISLQQHSIKNNFNYQYVKNDTTRLVAKCKREGCKWELRCKCLYDGKTMEVSKLNGPHSCVGVNGCGNEQATCYWIAYKILKDVKKNPDIKPGDIADGIKNKYGLTINYNRAWRGREKAREMIFGNVEATYDLVLTLKNELLKRNPGSHVDVQLEDDNSFKRMFVCFNASIQGFLYGIRPFIGLDGCHLKSKYLGTLLIATAVDGNYGLFPIAFAVVEGESGESWHWFLQNLIVAVGSKMQNITIMSDQEKGLLQAVSILLPNAEHRICVRHLWKNFKKDFQGDFFEKTLWDAARAYTSGEFHMHMRALDAVSHAAYTRLTSNQHPVWCRSKFINPARNHYIVNNLSESMNAWILDVRFLPAVDLVDKLRSKFMEKFNKRRKQGLRWKGKLVPYADRFCQDLSKKLGGYTVRHTNDNEAEVENEYERRVIDLVHQTCSCRKWQIIGLPCIHVAHFIGSIRNADWSQFCDFYYSVDSYRLAYAESIGVLPSRDQWEPYQKDFTINPPHTKRPRGRPKKKRVRGKEEDELGRTRGKVSKRVHRCSRCKELGHHKSSCKQPINTTSGQNQPQGVHAPRNDGARTRRSKLNAVRGRGRRSKGMEQEQAGQTSNTQPHPTAEWSTPQSASSQAIATTQSSQGATPSAAIHPTQVSGAEEFGQVN